MFFLSTQKNRFGEIYNLYYFVIKYIKFSISKLFLNDTVKEKESFVNSNTLY